LEKDQTVVLPGDGITLRNISHELAHALDYLKEKEHQKQGKNQQSPRERWKMIQQTGYRENLGPKTIGSGYADQWSNGSREPRNGFVMAYGANNQKEDLATCVEAAYTWPSDTWAYMLTPDITHAFWLQLNLPQEKSLVFKQSNGTVILLGKKRKPLLYDIVLEKKTGLHRAIIHKLSKRPTLDNLLSIALTYGGNVVNAWYDPPLQKKIRVFISGRIHSRRDLYEDYEEIT